MKRFLSTLFVVFLSINIAQATNWYKIDDNLYYDTETFEYTNNGAQFWLKNNTSNGYIKALINLNLDEKTYIIEQSYTYNKNNALISSNKAATTGRVIPDTISESFYNYFVDEKANRSSVNTNIPSKAYKLAYLSNDYGSSSGINASKEPDFGPYMKELQRRIKLNWEPPKGNEIKQVVLIFKIAKDGRLVSCKVHKSSGLPAVDKAALEAVELTAPFRPLPSSFSGKSVDIQFTFDYNAFNAFRL